ncbi:hypothetical protein PRELSG_0026100 [Plasmodium relictum]|uniref:Surface-associated interspersed protein (SURFIN) n=1 Tax=Plasmodium relictum TaxID=85471 RepID=A0A1J1GNV0_PLARL|nr:hypothetical protein PRELSG_0026100 [Plasmodium relictum]CRG84713.1 hypothetical protein PRELSG_0026100 [Plasmodium relictum]
MILLLILAFYLFIVKEEYYIFKVNYTYGFFFLSLQFFVLSNTCISEDPIAKEILDSYNLLYVNSYEQPNLLNTVNAGINERYAVNEDLNSPFNLEHLPDISKIFSIDSFLEGLNINFNNEHQNSGTSVESTKENVEEKAKKQEICKQKGDNIVDISCGSSEHTLNYRISSGGIIDHMNVDHEQPNIMDPSERMAQYFPVCRTYNREEDNVNEEIFSHNVSSNLLTNNRYLNNINHNGEVLRPTIGTQNTQDKCTDDFNGIDLSLLEPLGDLKESLNSFIKSYITSNSPCEQFNMTNPIERKDQEIELNCSKERKNNDSHESTSDNANSEPVVNKNTHKYFKSFLHSITNNVFKMEAKYISNEVLPNLDIILYSLKDSYDSINGAFTREIQPLKILINEELEKFDLHISLELEKNFTNSSDYLDDQSINKYYKYNSLKNNTSFVINKEKELLAVIKSSLKTYEMLIEKLETLEKVVSNLRMILNSLSYNSIFSCNLSFLNFEDIYYIIDVFKLIDNLLEKAESSTKRGCLNLRKKEIRGVQRYLTKINIILHRSFYSLGRTFVKFFSFIKYSKEDNILLMKYLFYFFNKEHKMLMEDMKKIMNKHSDVYATKMTYDFILTQMKNYSEYRTYANKFFNININENELDNNSLQVIMENGLSLNGLQYSLGRIKKLIGILSLKNQIVSIRDILTSLSKINFHERKHSPRIKYKILCKDMEMNLLKDLKDFKDIYEEAKLNIKSIYSLRYAEVKISDAEIQILRKKKQIEKLINGITSAKNLINDKILNSNAYEQVKAIREYILLSKVFFIKKTLEAY